jgi:hypothetical protein
MKLAFTPEAERQAAEMDTWWREHRAAARDPFARKLAEATRRGGGASSRCPPA